MLKRTLALAACFALSLSASLTQADTLKELKVSAIPDEAPPSCCASSSRWANTCRNAWACR